jgi:aminopeptidase N
MADELASGTMPVMDPKILDAYDHILTHAMDGDMALSAMMLSMPSMNELVEAKVREGKADPLALDKALDLARVSIRAKHAAHIENLHDTTRAPEGETYAVTPDQVGRRALHNTLLGYIAEVEDSLAINKAKKQFDTTDNMTERAHALSILSRIHNGKTVEAKDALESFYQNYKDDQNVVDNWLRVKAAIPGPDALENVKTLMKHEAFDIKNPNKVRALLGGFMSNTKAFHAEDGSGYTFMADQIIRLNGINPRMGAGLMRPFLQWNKYSDPHASLMKAEIQRILKTPELAMGIKEFAQKALAMNDNSKSKAKGDAPARKAG